jgi:DNA polymerase-1
VTILHPVKAGEIARIGPGEVRQRYGVNPEQVPDFIALRGDPSDKLPGARGIGEKTAASLLQRYPNLEAMLADGKFETQADDLRLYKRIATMVTNAPLPKVADQTPDWDKAAALAREWELRALSERLSQLAKTVK